jgi:hypothetical protein
MRGICARACVPLFQYYTPFFSTPTLPLCIFNTQFYLEMHDLSIEILRTILFAHPKEKTRSKVRKKNPPFLQKLLNFHYFLSFSLHLHYSHAFQMYLCIQKRIRYQMKSPYLPNYRRKSVLKAMKPPPFIIAKAKISACALFNVIKYI